jgi:hypothetical protein
MKQRILLVIALNLFIKSYSQTIDYQPTSDYLFGTWTDTIHSNTGDGFIFTPDSCCRFITNGEMTECEIVSQNLKVHFRADYNVKPRQLDILLINLKTDSIIGIIPMIFEIIDDNHIKLATYKTKSNNRPTDFNQREDVEIALLTRYIEKNEINIR